MADTAPQNTTAPARPGFFRPDIEGLRAVAIGLVLIYHAGVRQLPGGFVGVDVFFVISGFLITGLLIREIEKTGRVSLPRFYARRAKRLLPATGLVLIVTTFLTWLTVSVIDWRNFGLDIVTAATYVVNWRLAFRSVDYLAEDVGASPVQHFWSLAVEEQFYIVWPLLLVVLAWWLRRHPSVRTRPVLAAGIVAVMVPSFCYSIYLTATNPGSAFFVTPTRLWELGIGALLAIGATVWTRVPRTVAIPLGWTGLVVVAACGFVLNSETAWPGYAALAPTLGTAAVIVAGYTSGRAGPYGLLSWKPAVWVGGLSYSLYLWHWPLIVAATAVWGELGGKKGLVVAAVAFIPAYLSYKLIENPIRHSPAVAKSNRLALSLGVNFTVLGVIAGLILMLLVPTTGAGNGQQAAGARALSMRSGDAGTVPSLKSVEWFVPAATTAVDDRPPAYHDDCQVSQTDPEPKLCEWGDPDGDITVGVVGDSKILQYQSALDTIARDHGWRIISYTKSACGFHDGMQVANGKAYTSCEEWNNRVLDELVAAKPDAVLTSERIGKALEDPNDLSTRSTGAMADAMVRQWTALTDAGIPLIVFLDNPNPGMTVYECVAEHPDDLAACTFDRDEGVNDSGAVAQQRALDRMPHVLSIDLRPLICPEETCVPVIGNVLLYRQSSHLTDTYVRTLTEPLERRLVPAVEEALDR